MRFETLHRVTLSTQLIKTDQFFCDTYPLGQSHSFFRNLPAAHHSSPSPLRQNVFFCCRNHDTVQRFGGDLTGKGGSELVFPQVANLQTVGGQLTILSNFCLAYSENHFQQIKILTFALKKQLCKELPRPIKVTARAKA